MSYVDCCPNEPSPNKALCELHCTEAIAKSIPTGITWIGREVSFGDDDDKEWIGKDAGGKSSSPDDVVKLTAQEAGKLRGSIEDAGNEQEGVEKDVGGKSSKDNGGELKSGEADKSTGSGEDAGKWKGTGRDVGGKSSSADEDSGGESMGVGRDAVGKLLHAQSNSYNAYTYFIATIVA